MPHWRAIQVHSQRETAVERTLTENDVPVFCPRIRVRMHRAGSPVVARPLFPSYLFADIEAQPVAIVKHCHYVIGILGTVAIPTPIMDAIREISANVCVSPQWVVGQYYRLRGPQALAGILVRLEALDDHARASVLLNLFGAERVASVSVDDLTEEQS